MKIRDPRNVIITTLIFSLCGKSAAAQTPWAAEVVEASPSLDGTGLYNDPLSALGPPARQYFDLFQGAQMRSSLVAAPFNRTSKTGGKILVRLNPGDFLKLKFAQPIEDDPRNPYGVDFILFGNAFFAANKSIGPDADMDNVILIGGFFAEEVTVAVSQSGLGDPATHPGEWHVFDAGPFGDGLFPTQGYAWDSCESAWTGPLNFTKPVNPRLAVDDFFNLTAAEGIELYGASGGGTGFDLAESGLPWIQYVYLTGMGGEVDALADVRPGGPYLADADRDGDVDLADWAVLQRCFTGSSGQVPCECERVDVLPDGRVDGADHRFMLEDWTGPEANP